MCRCGVYLRLMVCELKEVGIMDLLESFSSRVEEVVVKGWSDLDVVPLEVYSSSCGKLKVEVPGRSMIPGFVANVG